MSNNNFIFLQKKISLQLCFPFDLNLFSLIVGGGAVARAGYAYASTRCQRATLRFQLSKSRRNCLCPYIFMHRALVNVNSIFSD